MLEQVSQLAQLTKPVLVLGERGTGKELIASRLHYLSPRWQGPFISLNCAALNENLLDSELFGYEAGAFTGAQHRHLGRFERADGGTLFLDELATAPMLVQEKLLRVIEYGVLERVGGSQPLQVDVRLVCATNEDLPTLATMCRELKLPLFTGFSAHARDTLLNYAWPGNVRELKNVVERSVYRHGAAGEPLDAIIINPFQRTAETPVTPVCVASTLPRLPLALREWQQTQEKALIEKALSQARFNQRKAATLLGLTYHQLRGLLKKYDIASGEG
uniref:Sigma-54 factor interaction domain-containing protein n=1 Tax=Rhodnius prolixus TaxID=13249 RepID=T1H9K6_RHOPR